MLAEVDVMEKEKDFALSAQVSELQWRAEALGRGLQDLTRLRQTEASDDVIVTEGRALLGKRGELEKKITARAAESSAIRVKVDMVAVKQTIAASGRVVTIAPAKLTRVSWKGERGKGK